jgi:hypothetical protein
MWLTRKDDSNISARFIFIIVGSLAIVLPSMLLNLSMQRNFDTGFMLMLEEQHAFFRYRSAENDYLIKGNTDPTITDQLSALTTRTGQLISVINNVEARMVSESGGQSGPEAEETQRVSGSVEVSNILFNELKGPFDLAVYGNHLLPGTGTREMLDNALLGYADFLNGMEPAAGLSREAMLLQPSVWFPEPDQSDRDISLISSIHLLELMKNTVLTVEARAIKAIIEN